ncbi:hypothetical protein KQI82_09280 [Oscillibacter sp. MSJ-2]|uniref:DUF5105 domain-containing protein n=1 Tax=Dysosmobacter acutus TaxID=2841504 RepID=A0ABS6FC03_9FIRM|nr:hypothetical protein [Dysosmobacter acutus]MBU5627097.1 hypothetical protein [Dysosmobacter acutus]
MKKFHLLLSLCLILSACDGNTDTPTNAEKPNVSNDVIIEETPNVDDNQQGEVVSDTGPLYFESDEVVDKFFTDYNAIAEVVIPVEEIEKGNIRTKALVYIDDLSLEIINANDLLSVSMSSSIENEDTKLYAIFRDTIKAMNANTADEDIQSAWNAIHESGYLVEDYDFNSISITYVPSKELSWGTSDLRVDLEFPLK